MSLGLFQDAKNTFWSGYRDAMALRNGYCTVVLEPGQGGTEPTRTSMPHSGTRSRLLNTTMRSHTRPLCGAGGGGGGAPGLPAAGTCGWPRPRSCRHFCRAPVQDESR